jgi:hypothetical protein
MDVNQNSVDLAQYFETKIRVTASLSSLLANLRTFPQSDWSWVDFYIGTVVTKGSIGNLWNNYLKPWSEWLRIRPTGPRGRS